MEVSKLDINGLALLLKKVYLPMMEHLARNENNQEWLDTLSDFEQLLDQFLMLGGGQDLTKLENPLSNKINKTFPTSFPSLRDEYVFWQKQMIELSRQQQWMVQNWGEATIETDSTLRQVHYTLKLFRLVRDPIQVFTEKNTMKEIDFYVKSLASSLKAVILQPSSKSGIHSKFVELVASNTQVLARWMLRVLQPTNLLKPEADLVVNALKVWETQWAESKLEVVGKLTGPEFSAMFLATRTVLESIQTVQSLIKETKALREMTEQIDDYFARQRLAALIRDDLEQRIVKLDIKLFLVDNQEEFQKCVHNHHDAQKRTETEIKATIKNVLDAHTSFEGLKLLKKIIDKSQSLAGTHSGGLDEFLEQNQREQLNRLSTELRLIRRGFDMTDYLNEKEVGENVDMAQRLFERRLLYHRVKLSLLTIFPHPTDWDKTAASTKIKEQYVELAKYLKSTEDKLHNKWFTTVQKRANKAMTRPILKKTAKGYVTTLQDTLMTIWDETRLFLQTRFQVPHVCHILLMQKPDLIHHNRAVVAILERLVSVVEKLTPFEFVVLNSCYSSVEDGLNLGTTHITWPSLCLASYIQELMESVERFQGMAEDVALISTLLDRRIAQINDFRLLVDTQNDLSPIICTGPPSASQFFKKLSQSGDEFFQNVRRVVSDLPPILLQVESIVCNSQTGSAPELQNYYDYWREKIYEAILKAVQTQLFDALSNLLENGPAQFLVQLSLRDSKVTVEPDLESIERDIFSIAHHWIECSSIVPDWQEGSCIALPVDQRSLHDRLSREPLLKVTVQRDQEHCKHLVGKLRGIIDRWKDCSELWSVNKVAACEKLRRTSPTLSQYDEQMQHYRNYWSDRVGAMEAQVVASCITLQMKQLKMSALEHIREWIRQLGATWMAGTRDKLEKVDGLVKIRHLQTDGSTDIDIEILMTEVQESWHRLSHYNIIASDEARTKLKTVQLRRIQTKLKAVQFNAKNANETDAM